MATQSVCAHCGFRNGAQVRFCNRCEQPLAAVLAGRAAAAAPEKTAALTVAQVDADGHAEGDRTEVSYAPTRRPDAAPVVKKAATPATPAALSAWPVTENSFTRRPRPAPASSTTTVSVTAPPHHEASAPTQIGAQAPRQAAVVLQERTQISTAARPRAPAPAPLPPAASAPPPRPAAPPALASTTMLDQVALQKAWDTRLPGEGAEAADAVQRPTQHDPLSARVEARARPHAPSRQQPRPQQPKAPQPPPRLSDAATQLGQLDRLVPQPQQPVASASAATLAPLTRQAVALVIDAALVALAMAAYAAADIAALHGSWPSERATGLEAVAWWMYVYHRSVRRIALVGLLVAALHAALGVRHGRTLGRLVVGLRLVPRDGQSAAPAALSWSTAAWHLLGCALCLLSMGAGVYWMVLDAHGRTWANLLSRTLVVRRA